MASAGNREQTICELGSARLNDYSRIKYPLSDVLVSGKGGRTFVSPRSNLLTGSSPLRPEHLLHVVPRQLELVLPSSEG